MADAAESLDLSGVLATLERWRRVAWCTQDDPDAHHRMLEHADRLNASQDITAVPWDQVKARLGLSYRCIRSNGSRTLLGHKRCLSQSSASWAISCQPWSIVRECPRSANSRKSVIAGDLW